MNTLRAALQGDSPLSRSHIGITITSLTTPAPPSLNSDGSRTAVAALRGYAYQIWRSVYEWLLLQHDETLLLEGNEDIDRLRGSEDAETIQVKDTAGSGSLTLRSTDVIEAINNLWNTRHANPTVSVRMRFIGTASIGRERDSPFGERRGIDVWTSVRRSVNPARDIDDSILIRDFLLSLVGISPNLREWLLSARGEDVAADLIHRIVWDMDSPATPAICEMIDGKLIELGERFEILPRDSCKVRSRLLELALLRATQTQDRRLTRAELLTVFESETTLTVPRSAVAAALNRAPNNSPSALQHETLSDFSAVIASVRRNDLALTIVHLDRPTEVERIRAQLSGRGLAIVGGSTGMGKSTLVQLAIAPIVDSVLWLDLRSLDKGAHSRVLRQLSNSLPEYGTLKCIVLDDLTFEGDSRPTQSSVESLVVAASARNISVVATTPACPPASLLRRLGIGSSAYLEAPYLTETEIATLLELSGHPANDLLGAHSRIVLAHTRGHPQLVAARLAALAASNFAPPSPGSIFAVPQEIQEARAHALSLVSALPKDDRELLYKLSVTSSRFDKSAVLSLAGQPPQVSEPGVSFQRLVGPWIERVGDDIYRISPLVSNIGSDARGPDWLRSAHSQMSRALFRGSIGPERCSAILLHAVLGRNDTVIVQLCQALLSTAEDLRGLADWMHWIKFVDLTHPSDPIVKSWHGVLTVRLFLLDLATESDPDYALRSADLLDSHTLLSSTPDEVQRLSRVLALSKILTKTQIKLSPRKVLAYVSEITSLQETLKDLQELRSIVAPIELEELPGEYDGAWMAPFLLHNRLCTIDDMRDFVDALRGLDVGMRTRMLAPLVHLRGLSEHLSNTVWLSEWRSDAPDWPRFVEAMTSSYRDLHAIGAGALAAAVGGVVARTVWENIGDAKEALRLARDFASQCGETAQLLDVMAATLDSQGDIESALDTCERAVRLAQPSRFDSITKPQLLRRRALIATRLRRFEDATVSLTEAARLSADRPDRRAAFLADAGCSALQCGDFDRSIDLLFESLEQLRAVPNTPEKPQAFRVHKVVGHALTALAKQAECDEVSIEAEVPTAICSSFDVKDELLELPTTPLEYSLLNLCRFAVRRLPNDDRLASTLLALRQSQFRVVRFMAAFAECDAAILAHRQEGFPALALRCARIAAGIGASRQANAPTVYDTSSPDSDLLIDPEFGTITCLLSSMLVSVAAESKCAVIPSSWMSEIHEPSYPKGVVDWLRASDLIHDMRSAQILAMAQRHEIRNGIFACLSVACSANSTPTEVLLAHVNLVNFLDGKALLPSVTADLFEITAAYWRSLASNGFQLVSPRNSVPALRIACAQARRNKRAIGCILLAASEAIGLVLPTWAKDLLNKGDSS